MSMVEETSLILTGIVVFILVVAMFIFIGADITMNEECQALGFYEGHFDLSSWEGVCYYEQLGVPMRELLKEATS